MVLDPANVEGMMSSISEICVTMIFQLKCVIVICYLIVKTEYPRISYLKISLNIM